MQVKDFYSHLADSPKKNIVNAMAASFKRASVLIMLLVSIWNVIKAYVI